MEELQQVDERPPILFLRAFRNDRIELPRGRRFLLARILELGRRRNNLDQMLLEELTPYGALVALGSPRDRFPPYGAARGYFTDQTWHQAVERLVRDSTVTVLCVDDTEGIWWEVEHLAGRRRENVLFLIHPSYRSVDKNSELLGRLCDALGLAAEQKVELAGEGAPQPSGRKRTPTVLGFFFVEGRLRVLRSSTFFGLCLPIDGARVRTGNARPAEAARGEAALPPRLHGRIGCGDGLAVLPSSRFGTLSAHLGVYELIRPQGHPSVSVSAAGNQGHRNDRCWRLAVIACELRSKFADVRCSVQMFFGPKSSGGQLSAPARS